MESPTRLYLIRHGEVEERYHRVFGGRIDMELSPFGREQARRMAVYLERIPFDAIYASPMKRAQQTIEELVSRQNKRAVLVEGLREVDFGVWTGLSWEQVMQQFNVSAFEWLNQLQHGLISGAETAGQFRERVEPCLRKILMDHPGQTVAVVCHGGVIRVILAILLDIPLVKTASLDIEYAGFTIIDHQPRKTEVLLLNFTPWRDLA